MIDELRATALLGTSREPSPQVETGSEIDAVLASIASEDRERDLLLTAGALAVWQRAGYRPATVPAPKVAPPETLPGCNDRSAEHLRQILRGNSRQLVLQRVLDPDAPHPQAGLVGAHADLLLEALELLRSRGLRLRYHLLPDVLPARTEELRTALWAVIGERGRWLAGFNRSWVWATDTMPPYAEWLWENGATEYRVDLLTSQRRSDPAGARSRLEAHFPSERSEVRLKLLAALQTGLSPDDEPFLEGVLDSGTPTVRLRATRLLAKLPQSACTHRLRERADTMLVVTGESVEVTLSSVLDPAWQREGLELNSGLPGVDAPGCWLLHTVGLIPVRHWVNRFGMTLEALIAGLEGGRRLEVLEAWTNAAVFHGERDLLPTLWDAWWEHRTAALRTPYLLTTLWSDLASEMAPSAQGNRLARLMADPPGPEATCGRILGAVRAPWPKVAGDAFLQVLHEVVHQLSVNEAPPPPWRHVLIPGARSIPLECIQPAMATLSDLPPLDAPLNQWQPLLDLVTEKLRVRQQFIQELER